MFKAALITLSIFALTYGRPQAPVAATAPASASSSPAAAPAKSGNVTYVKNDRTPLDDKGGYKYDIELSDGTKLIQEGVTEAPAAGENETSIVIKGSYTYISPDGSPVSVMYIANKDGYQPTGSVIPKDTNSSAASKSASPSASPSAASPSASPSAAASASVAPASHPAPVLAPVA